MPHQPIACGIRARSNASAGMRDRNASMSPSASLLDGRQLLCAERRRRRRQQSVVDLAKPRQQVLARFSSGLGRGRANLVDRPHASSSVAPMSGPALSLPRSTVNRATSDSRWRRQRTPRRARCQPVVLDIGSPFDVGRDRRHADRPAPVIERVEHVGITELDANRAPPRALCDSTARNSDRLPASATRSGMPCRAHPITCSKAGPTMRIRWPSFLRHRYASISRQ